MNKTHAVIVLGLMVVSAGLDAIFGKALFTGFAVVIGTAGSVALIFGTRWLGLIVKRPESWHGIDTPPDTHPDLAGGHIHIGEGAYHD
jgi:hypothetical protein